MGLLSIPSHLCKKICWIVLIAILIFAGVIGALVGLKVIRVEGIYNCSATKPYASDGKYEFDPKSYKSLIVKLGGYSSQSSIRFERHNSSLIVIDKQFFVSTNFETSELKANSEYKNDGYQFTISDGNSNANDPSCYKADVVIKIPNNLDFYDKLIMDVYRTNVNLDIRGKLDFNQFKIDTGFGDLKLANNNVKKVDLDVNHSDLEINDIKADTFNAKVNFGESKIQKLTADKITIGSQHGDVSIHNTKSDTILLDNSFGKIEILNGNFLKADITNTHGNVNVEIDKLNNDIKDLKYNIAGGFGECKVSFKSTFNTKFDIGTWFGSIEIDSNNNPPYYTKKEEKSQSGILGNDNNSNNNIKIQNENGNVKLLFP
ncbi:hypothetical protein K502DRAFT_363480 [Neoconidiobolus thromboides FSU 785]|nr:hypothetical protein K502DRAFT_363480 [Neoconidiobolus thromboides FSU 785]